VDSATILGFESESGTLVPARACAMGADGPQQGFLSDGASFVPAPEAPRRARSCSWVPMPRECQQVDRDGVHAAAESLPVLKYLLPRVPVT
jgi:hypothetical protein